MKELVINEASFETKADLHAYLAAELAFPDYYGANLDALHDCLSDIGYPLFVRIVRDSSAPRPFTDAFVRVFRASASEFFIIKTES